MSTALKLRRGTTTQHNSFTGAQYEVTLDTTLYTLRLHDGSTVGGFPLARKTGETFTGDISVTKSGSNSVVGADRSDAATAGKVELISGDTVNALLSYGTKDLVMGTNGGEDGRIDSAGRWHMGGNGGTYRANVYDATDAFTYYKAGSNTGMLVGQDSNGDAYLLNLSSATLRLGTNNTEHFRLGAAGQIGLSGANYGTDGQVLMSKGPSAPPQWGTAGGGFAAGTRLAFQQTNAPTGWTKDTTAAINDSILRLVTGTVGSGGSTAFSTYNGVTSVGATTLAESQIPSHTHVQRNYGSGKTSGQPFASGTAGTSLTNSGVSTAATGGGGSHTHSVTRNIKYYDFIIATKD